MKVIIAKDYNEVSELVAKQIVKEVNEKPNLVFCLPAGNSPIGMYKKLVEFYNQGVVDFSKMRTFDMDEYVGLSKENVNSFAYFMNKHFLNHVNIDRTNVRLPDALAQDIHKECEVYAKEIANIGGFDIAITGIGDNGHIAFNEPNQYLMAKTHVVDLREATIIQNKKEFQEGFVPTKALSIGMEEIMKTKHFIVIACGKHKASLLSKLFEDNRIDPMYPVSFIKMHHNITLFLDEEAASLLPIDKIDAFI